MAVQLLDEYPLLVFPTLAVKLGLNESLILQQVHYWVQHNKKTNRNFKDGEYWTFNTYDNWQEQFPFFSKSTVVRTIQKLVKDGLLITGNYNKMKMDKTKWYRINYNKLYSICESPCSQNDNMSDGNLSITLPETYPDTKKENTEEGGEAESTSKTTEQITTLYKEHCPNLPAPIKITDKRRKAINARLKEHTIEDFETVFKTLGNSRFHNGENDRDWKANLDWVLKPDNFIKILERSQQQEKEFQNDFTY